MYELYVRVLYIHAYFLLIKVALSLLGRRKHQREIKACDSAFIVDNTKLWKWRTNRWVADQNNVQTSKRDGVDYDKVISKIVR